MSNIGKNIRNFRKEKNLTQDELAEKLFITRQTLSNYENGRSNPDIDMLMKIAHVFEIDVNAVVYGIKHEMLTYTAGKKRIITDSIVIPLLIACIAVFMFHHEYIHIEAQSYFIFTLYILIPMIYVIIGWHSADLLSGFVKIKLFNGNISKKVKVIVLAYLFSALGILLPVSIWWIAGDIEFYFFNDGYENLRIFEYVFIYSEVEFALSNFNYFFPFVYLLPGVLLWLSSFPKRRFMN